jgi:probable O-glycosylation ligase (exosortase A-associated)
MKGLIFTYVLSYGGALVSLVNPFIGLLIYVCFSILKPEALWSWSLPEGGYFSRIVAVALLMGWAFRGFGRWQFGRARGLVAAFVGLWTWSVLSAASAPNQGVAWVFVEGLTKILLPFLAGVTLIDSVAKLKQLAWVMMVSQGYLAFEFNVSYLWGTNIVRTLGFAGMDNNAISIAMVTGAGLAFFLGLAAERWWHKGLAFSACLLMIHVVFFSFSRGGMLALITLGLAALVMLPKQPKHYLVFGVAALLALRLAGPEVRERFMSGLVSEEDRDFSAQSRVELWAVCWDLMLKYPVLGVGPDHFPIVVREYGWRAGKEAHTLWLQTGAELGFPGLICLVLFYGLAVTRLFPLARGRLPVPDPWFRHIARMVIVALAGFAVSAQFVTVEGLELPYYITLIGAGVLKLSSLAVAGDAPTGGAPAVSRVGRR